MTGKRLKILMITAGYAPFMFSEAIVNAKLVLALHKNGHKVDVITKVGEGKLYSASWQEPWIALKESTYIIQYNLGNKAQRLIDYLRSIILLKFPISGLRWASRAYKLSLKLHSENKYDLILTRSPAETGHIVGLKLKKSLKLPWVANWNDPATGIWPGAYEEQISIFTTVIHRLFISQVLNKADINSFPSQRLKNHFFKHYKFNMHDCYIFPHISLLDELFPYQPIVKNNIFKICLSGNLSKERNPEIVLKAITKLKLSRTSTKIQFDIFGVGNDKIIELIDEFKLNDCVKFIGPLPYLELLRIMQTYDLICLLEANLTEGIFLPSKLSDMVQCNKPILAICPRIGEVNDLIQYYGGGFSLDNENEYEVFSGLKYLYDLWVKNKLSHAINPKPLRYYFSTTNVLSEYDQMFRNLGVL